MTYKYLTKPSSLCLPFSRSKLLREVFEFKTCGEIHQVFLGAGHLFATTKGGRNLFTFDCKAAENLQDSESSGCLDIIDDAPVLKILLRPPQTVFVVFANGATQVWNYRTDHFWSRHAVLKLCHNHLATVTDVCFNITQNAVYWCQQEVSECGTTVAFYICKRQVIEGEGKITLPKFGPTSTIIKNCPKSSVYPLGHGIIFVTENKSDQAQFIVKLCTLSGHVNVLVDNEWVHLREMSVHTAVNFSQIVLSCLQHLSQLSVAKVLHSAYVANTQTLHILYSNGQLGILSHHPEISVKKLGNIEKFTDKNLVGMFIFGQAVGLAYQNIIRLYNLKDGTLTNTVDMPDNSRVLGVVHSIFSNIQQAIYTSDNLLSLQKYSDNKDKSEMSLMEFSHFQSDAVRLSYVDKVQKYAADKGGTLTLENLEKRWLENLNIPTTSKLEETVEPYLKQYWKLEKLLQNGLKNPKSICEVEAHTVEQEVIHLLDTKSAMSRSARQSQLMLLAQFHPVEVLDTLLSYLPLTEGELSTSQQQKWRCALTQETCDVSGSCDIAVPLFELMCHLLYKHKPDRLFQFVQYGQRVWDQKVGMSAFVRRRQVPLILERALKCLPLPESSCDPGTAVTAHVSILLMSEANGSFIKAVYLLLRAEKWSETVELLKQYRNSCAQFPLLYQMTMAALVKKQMLPKYAEQIFSLMPSFGSANNIIVSSPPKDCGILCEKEVDISVESVRPHLLQCLNIYDEEPS